MAELSILRARRSLPEVILDPATDDDTRAKLSLAVEARTFAREVLELEVGDTYTSFAHLDRDTLAMVLSASYRDRLEPRTWWFPIVGHVPYRAFFGLDDALSQQRSLESEGFDTYLRPTSAFSTLGWFADPILSTMLRTDHVGLVETILHELSHAHLFVPGRVQFNESYATFVGSVGAIRFFCGRRGGGPDTVKCKRARQRWNDEIRFSAFLDELVDDLVGLYGDTTVTSADKVDRRADIFDESLRIFREEVQPAFRASTFQSFVTTPLNNATLLARMRYYHRLGDFQAFLDARGGDLVAALADLRAGARSVPDPFDLLPRTEATEVPATGRRVGHSSGVPSTNGAADPPQGSGPRAADPRAADPSPRRPGNRRACG